MNEHDGDGTGGGGVTVVRLVHAFQVPVLSEHLA